MRNVISGPLIKVKRSWASFTHFIQLGKNSLASLVRDQRALLPFCRKSSCGKLPGAVGKHLLFLGSVQGNGVCEAPEVLNHFPSTLQVKNTWKTPSSAIPEAGGVKKDLIPGKDAVQVALSISKYLQPSPDCAWLHQGLCPFPLESAGKPGAVWGHWGLTEGFLGSILMRTDALHPDPDPICGEKRGIWGRSTGHSWSSCWHQALPACSTTLRVSPGLEEKEQNLLHLLHTTQAGGEQRRGQMPRAW